MSDAPAFGAMGRWVEGLIYFARALAVAALFIAGVILTLHAGDVGEHPKPIDPAAPVSRYSLDAPGTEHFNRGASQAIQVMGEAALCWVLATWQLAHLRMGPKPWKWNLRT
jgi:hypothetical protein